MHHPDMAETTNKSNTLVLLCCFCLCHRWEHKVCIDFSGVALGQAIQSMVSLMSLLRGQLIKCFMTLQRNTLKFVVEKMREAFAVQKLFTFFQQKIMAYFR